MSGGANKDRINEDSYWYNKHSDAVNELNTLQKKTNRYEKALKELYFQLYDGDKSTSQLIDIARNALRIRKKRK